MSHEGWTTLGAADPSQLSEARLQLHYATQLVAAVGDALAPKQDDDGQSSLRWDPLQRLFLGTTIESGRPLRVAINPETLKLLIVETAGVAKVFALDGHTLDEALEWLRNVLGSESIALRKYDEPLPDHPLAHGGRFNATHEKGGKVHRAELVHYYGNTHWLLEKLIGRGKSSQVRLWPHHFDLAATITLQGEGKSLGIGVSPGDKYYNQPYWYATPSPAPDPAALPDLAGDGQWHTNEWTGAVLTAADLLSEGRLQLNQVREFFGSVAAFSGTKLG